MILVLGFGPNVTTYVLPTQCYGAQIRSSAHGLSSAAGKLGAILGTVVFPAIMAVGRLEHVASVRIGVFLTQAQIWKYIILDSVSPISNFDDPKTISSCQ